MSALLGEGLEESFRFIIGFICAVKTESHGCCDTVNQKCEAGNGRERFTFHEGLLLSRTHHTLLVCYLVSTVLGDKSSLQCRHFFAGSRLETCKLV